MLRAVKRLVEKLFGIYLLKKLPRGVNFYEDLTRFFPTYKIDVVFDVGANVGDLASAYVIQFPHAHIFCFEPASHTYGILERKFKGNDRVSCFRKALGASESKATLILEGSSDMFYISDSLKEIKIGEKKDAESVVVTTLDSFCNANNIHYINYVKIDTEGYELEVLKGASGMLAAHSIDFIEVEAGMNPGNVRHVPMEILKDFFEKYQYVLFGLYEQVHEWPTKEPHLRRANLIFLSRTMIEKRSFG